MVINIQRKMDHLGRIVLPLEFREALGLKESDAVSLTLAEDLVTLEKATPRCVFCEEKKGLLPAYLGKRICRRCLEKLQR